MFDNSHSLDKQGRVEIASITADQISIAQAQLSELSELEERVEARTAELRAANQSLQQEISDRKAIERRKDEFIAVISHELRTPLTSLQSALKILATGRLGTLLPDGQQMLEIADKNTDRLVRLVNSLLDLQRIESGEVQMEKQACSAAALMAQAVESMQPMAQQHGVKLSMQPIEQPIEHLIWVDFDYIVQALTNLLSNAIKFSSAGGTVWLIAEAKATELLFQVRDQGQGIPDHKLESIFERFQQVDSNSRRKGGTGLGLTICRQIIERHQGKIWAESELGQGSSFLFTVPVFKLPANLAAKPTSAARRHNG